MSPWGARRSHVGARPWASVIHGERTDDCFGIGVAGGSCSPASPRATTSAPALREAHVFAPPNRARGRRPARRHGRCRRIPQAAARRRRPSLRGLLARARRLVPRRAGPASRRSGGAHGGFRPRRARSRAAGLLPGPRVHRPLARACGAARRPVLDSGRRRRARRRGARGAAARAARRGRRCAPGGDRDLPRHEHSEGRQWPARPAEPRGGGRRLAHAQDDRRDCLRVRPLESRLGRRSLLLAVGAHGHHRHLRRRPRGLRARAPLALMAGLSARRLHGSVHDRGRLPLGLRRARGRAHRSRHRLVHRRARAARPGRSLVRRAQSARPAGSAPGRGSVRPSGKHQESPRIASFSGSSRRSRRSRSGSRARRRRGRRSPGRRRPR